MKIWLTIATGILAITASAADWKQSLTPPKPGKFPPPRPSHLTYTFGWSAVPAAEGAFDLSRPQPGQLELDFTTKTIGGVRGLFRLDAQHMAIADESTLQPIRMRQTEVYKDETIKTRVDFDPKGLTRVRSSNVPGPGNAKPKRFNFVPVHDLHSAYLWLRSQRLEPGDTYRWVVYPSADPFLAQARVTGREKVLVAGKSYPAIKIDLSSSRISKKLTLAPYSKLKRASAWLSDDNDRLLLKATAEIFIGSVWAELKTAEFPAP